MFSSRFYRRVSRQSASINYVFAFCSSLIIYFFSSTSTVHAQQHNDLYEMIKNKIKQLVGNEASDSNYDFRDEDSFSRIVQLFLFAFLKTLADGGNWARRLK